MKCSFYSDYRTRISQLGLLLICLLVFCWPQIGAAENKPLSDKHLLILVSKNSSIYQQVVHSLETELEKQQQQFTTRYLPEVPDADALRQFKLIVAVGTKATQEAMQINSSLPLLSTFIPRRTYQTLIDRDEGLKERQQTGNISALYLEQPFLRQLRLLSLIKPDIQTLATILGPTSRLERAPLEKAAEAIGWKLSLEQLGKKDNPIERLSPLIQNSDAFLALPDKSIFNRSTAKWILLMTFRQRIPLIAYSKRYVDAGAVAGVFSTPQTVGEETALLLKQWSLSGLLPKPNHPQLFDISVNRATARSLRLNLPPLPELKRQLEGQ